MFHQRYTNHPLHLWLNYQLIFLVCVGGSEGAGPEIRTLLPPPSLCWVSGVHHVQFMSTGEETLGFLPVRQACYQLSCILSPYLTVFKFFMLADQEAKKEEL